MSDFSCWGQNSTDVFGPGASIYSTVVREAAKISDQNEGVDLKDPKVKDVYSRSRYERFLPEATAAENLLTLSGAEGKVGIERFDGSESPVRIFDANPALDANAREIGGLNLTLGFDDKRSAAVPLGSVVKTIPGDVATGKPETMEGAVYLAIPVKSAADAKHVALQCAMSDAFKPSGSIAAITCAKKDGGAPVEINGTAVRTLKTGWTGAAGTNVYQCQWSNISYNIDEYIKASNKLRAMTDAEMEEQGVIRPGSYVDPGEVTGAYGWKDKGREYVIAKFNMTALSRMTSMSDSSTLLFDNVAVGNAHAAFGGYMIMSGTSMATPAVAGCVAVVAKDEPESKGVDEAALEQLARRTPRRSSSQRR